jgi:hypothetical protein
MDLSYVTFIHTTSAFIFQKTQETKVGSLTLIKIIISQSSIDQVSVLVSQSRRFPTISCRNDGSFFFSHHEDLLFPGFCLVGFGSTLGGGHWGWGVKSRSGGSQCQLDPFGHI